MTSGKDRTKMLRAVQAFCRLKKTNRSLTSRQYQVARTLTAGLPSWNKGKTKHTHPELKHKLSGGRSFHKSKTYYPSTDGSGKIPKWILSNLLYYTPKYLDQKSTVYDSKYIPLSKKFDFYNSND
mgnify:CR=1 FL=1